MAVCACEFAEAGEWHQLGWHERPGDRGRLHSSSVDRAESALSARLPSAAFPLDTSAKCSLQMTQCHQVQGMCMISSDTLGNLNSRGQQVVTPRVTTLKVHSLYKSMVLSELLFP